MLTHLPFQGRQGTSCQREAKSLPYGLKGFRCIETNEVHSLSFAALCNTPEVEPRGLCRFGSPKGIDKRKTDML